MKHNDKVLLAAGVLMFILLYLVVIAFFNPAHASDLRGVVTVASDHHNGVCDDLDCNEFNPGVGIQYAPFSLPVARPFVEAGGFINSFSDPTAYYGGGIGLDFRLGNWSIEPQYVVWGTYGYKDADGDPTTGDLNFPALSLQYKGVGARVLFFSSDVTGLQFVMDF